jgi:hypothetical protein
MLFFFSSPDHEVVKVRYSDGAMSDVVVCRQQLSCLYFSSHSFDWIIIKLCQNVSLNEIQAKLEYGSSSVNTRSQELKIEKSCYSSSGCSFDSNILEMCQEGCSDNI